MKQVLMALLITAFAYSSTEAQTCPPAATKKKTAAKPKPAPKPVAVTTSTQVTSTVSACRMVPYQVCKILPDRRSVSCYKTTDTAEHTNRTGATTYYGPTGPMPGEVVQFTVRTVVLKDEPKGSYCKRNAADNATLCYSPGYLLRDEEGYYSYGSLPEGAEPIVQIK